MSRNKKNVNQNLSKALIVLCVAFLISIFNFSKANAQGIPNCLQATADFWGDSTPDVLILECQIATSRDLVYIYDRDGDLLASDSRNHALDMHDDLWVFDIAADGTVNLIIDFHQENDTLIAELYDDKDGDQNIDITVNQREQRINITESHVPTVRALTAGDWWLSDQTVNFNVTLEIDGPVVASFAVGNWVETYVKNDGILDYKITIDDPDLNGRPNSHIVQFYLPVDEDWTFLRTALMVNEADDEPQMEGSVFWPFLGDQLYGFEKPRFESPPPIQVDWEQSRILFVGETVAGRANESSWFIYSLKRFGDPQSKHFANFENPFSFYDLANDDDRFPELIVRHAILGDQDEISASQVTQAVRYSWDQDNDNFLDFKLGLFGGEITTTTLQFGNVSVDTIPYLQLPYQVMEESWLAATFVAVEPEFGVYSSNEGIYEWDATSDLYKYLAGLTDESPTSHYLDIGIGLRGEFAFAPLSKARIYLSPIDQRIHLFNASDGVYRVSNTNRIRMSDLNEDGFFDQWILTETPGIEEQERAYLRHSADVLIFSENQTLRIVHIPEIQEPDIIIPPRNPDEWENLQQQVQETAGTLPTRDLVQWVPETATTLLEIEGIEISHFNPTASGFQLQVRILPDFKVLSDRTNALSNRSDISEGQHHHLSYDGDLNLSSLLSPPNLQLKPPGIQILPSQGVQGESIMIKALLENTGEQQTEEMDIGLYAQISGQEPILLYQELLKIPATGKVNLVHDWQPTASGDWKIWLEIIDSENNIRIIHEEYRGVSISQSKPVDLFRLSFLAPVYEFSLSTTLMLCSIVISIGSFSILIWRNTRNEPE